MTGRSLGEEPKEQVAAPTVSIVLVTYNRPAALRTTIEDLLQQSYSDFELIICDDSSPDPETFAICLDAAARDPRVRCLRQPINIGMPSNLNSGIRMSRGKYLAIAHDADRYDPDLIQCWLEALLSCPRALFVFNQYESLDELDRVAHIHKETFNSCNEGAAIIREFHRRWQFDSPIWGTVMARRQALLEEGLFDIQYGFFADVDMWLRLAERGHVAYVPRPLIRLANRSMWPRQFTIRSSEQRRIVRRIVFRSRMRVYRNRPLALASQLLRHLSFCLLDDFYVSLLAIRRRARSQLCRGYAACRR